MAIKFPFNIDFDIDFRTATLLLGVGLIFYALERPRAFIREFLSKHSRGKSNLVSVIMGVGLACYALFLWDSFNAPVKQEVLPVVRNDGNDRISRNMPESFSCLGKTPPKSLKTGVYQAITKSVANAYDRSSFGGTPNLSRFEMECKYAQMQLFETYKETDRGLLTQHMVNLVCLYISSTPGLSDLDKTDIVKVIEWTLYLMFSPSSPKTVSKSRDALDDIQEFVGSICQSTTDSGASETIDRSGAVSLKLSGLLNKLANIGIEGAAEYQKSDYKGVLQKDLAAVLSKDSDCKKDLSKMLIEKLIN